MQMIFKSYDELPLTLSAELVAMMLGISRSGAYELMHSKGFPSLRVGRRIVVPRDKLIEWMEKQAAKQLK